MQPRPRFGADPKSWLLGGRSGTRAANTQRNDSRHGPNSLAFGDQANERGRDYREANQSPVVEGQSMADRLERRLWNASATSAGDLGSCVHGRAMLNTQRFTYTAILQWPFAPHRPWTCMHLTLYDNDKRR
jgi:hypothetical protein